MTYDDHLKLSGIFACMKQSLQCAHVTMFTNKGDDSIFGKSDGHFAFPDYEFHLICSSSTGDVLSILMMVFAILAS